MLEGNTAPQGQAGTAFGEPTGAAAITTEPIAAPNWHDGLHKDFKVDPSIKTFIETEDGLNKFVESHLNLRKKVGTAVWIPGDNPTDEETADFRRKLGIPEAPDKYDLKYKEHPAIKISEEADKEWKALAHQIGLTPKQAQALTDFEFGRIEKSYTEYGKKFQEASDKLREEYGNGYQDVLDRANNTLRTFADQTTFDTLTNPDGPYANDPTIIKLLANIGNQMGEHTFKTGDPRTVQDTKDDLQRKILDQQKIYMDDSKSIEERKLANKEAQRLFEQLYGSAEVSSSADVKW